MSNKDKRSIQRIIVRRHVVVPVRGQLSGKTVEDKYLKIRDELNELETNQSNLYDKYLLTLSASALAFSLTYIDKILKVNQVVREELIIAAWVLLSFSMIFVLISFYASVSCCKVYKKQLDDYYRNFGEIREKFVSSWDCIISLLNNLSILSFVAGVISLIIFAICNLK